MTRPGDLNAKKLFFLSGLQQNEVILYGRGESTMRLHEKNKNFQWHSVSRPPTFLSTSQLGQYDEQGYILLKNCFSEDEIQRVAKAIDPFEVEHEALLRSQFNGKLFIAKADAITFTLHLVTKTAVCRSFALHPVFANLCQDIIGPEARLYWDQAVYKKPGNPEEFPWHQDNGYTYTEPQQYLTCWVPLSPATVDNGCPWVLPGVHRGGTLHHDPVELGLSCTTDSEGAIPIAADIGDLVVFSSLTPHRTGPNLTRDVRKSYILQYAPNGAVVHAPDGQSVTPANDPERQFKILGH